MSKLSDDFLHYRYPYDGKLNSTYKYYNLSESNLRSGKWNNTSSLQSKYPFNNMTISGSYSLSPYFNINKSSSIIISNFANSIKQLEPQILLLNIGISLTNTSIGEKYKTCMKNGKYLFIQIGNNIKYYMDYNRSTNKATGYINNTIIFNNKSNFYDSSLGGAISYSILFSNEENFAFNIVYLFEDNFNIMIPYSYLKNNSGNLIINCPFVNTSWTSYYHIWTLQLVGIQDNYNNFLINIDYAKNNIFNINFTVPTMVRNDSKRIKMPKESDNIIKNMNIKAGIFG